MVLNYLYSEYNGSWSSFIFASTGTGLQIYDSYLIFFFSSVARIQFKLPNGVSQIHRFDPADTIGDLYNHVINELTTPYGSNVSLSTTFPSRNLDDVERLVYESKI